MKFTCRDCGYFWKEENEERMSCHWTPRCPGDQAPCEYEPEYDEYEVVMEEAK